MEETARTRVSGCLPGAKHESMVAKDRNWCWQLVRMQRELPAFIFAQFNVAHVSLQNAFMHAGNPVF